MYQRLMELLIPSKAQREYLEANYHFTDKELANLIYHAPELSRKQILEELHALSTVTEDEGLKKEIEERLHVVKESQCRFEKKEKNQIFELVYRDENDEICPERYFFEDASVAKEFAKKVLKHKPYYLEKHYIQDSSLRKIDGMPRCFHYTPDSDVALSWCFGDEDGNNGDCIIQKNKKRFEWIEVKYPLVFKPGDIVKRCGSHVYGVIVPSDDEKELEIMEIYLDGKLLCTFFHPFFIDKADELPECSHMKILESISALYKGKISYKDFVTEYQWELECVAKNVVE